MKKIFLILLTVLIAGCMADRKGEPAIEAEKVLNCPEIVEAAAKNLEQIKVDQLTVQAWKNSVLSKKMQPCNACQELLSDNLFHYYLRFPLLSLSFDGPCSYDGISRWPSIRLFPANY